MSDLGAWLRQAREEVGITLEQAEQDTHIRGAVLRALEEGRFSELPGDVYGRGLVRNYARYIGLDPDAVVREFSRASGRPEQVIPQVLDEPLAPVRRGYGWIPALLLAVFLLATMGYLFQTQFVGRGLRLESLWPLVISTGQPARGSDVELEQVTPAGETLTPQPGSTPSATRPVGEPTALPSPTTEPTARIIALPTPRPTATETPTPIAGILIEALVSADTYFEVRTDGNLIYVGTMLPNETARWQAAERITLRVGNAGGVTLTVNGVDVGAPGQSGEVLDVEYTLDTLPGR